MSEPKLNPYSFSAVAHDQLVPEHDFSLPISYWGILRTSSLWMRLSAFLGSIAICCYAIPIVWFGVDMWREGELDHGNLVIAASPFCFATLAWPGYWLLRTTSHIHRVGEEQTLSAIADVLEAQRSFWRALGILVLLAITAIVALILMFSFVWI